MVSGKRRRRRTSSFGKLAAAIGRTGRHVERLEERRLLCGLSLDELGPAPEFDWDVEHHEAAQLESRGGPEATSIVWSNRGQASDGFAANFGTSAAAGRAVVDAVFDYWERIITDWNRANGTTTLQVNVSMHSTNTGFGAAAAPAATAPADGKPTTGSITINRGTLTANVNDSNNWFFDPTPFDNSEFMGNIINAYAGVDSAGVGSDLFSVVSAELAHVMGLIADKNNNGGSWDGYRLESSGFATFTDIDDNAEGGGNGHFWTFDGPTVEHLMTSFNSGDQNDASWGNVVHTAGGAGNINFAGKNWRGSEDTGNAIYGNERTLPSFAMTHILGDAYGYTVNDPETFGTFYAVLNETTNVVTVRGGAGTSSDAIVVSVNAGGQLQVSVDIGNDIAGTGHLPGVGNLGAFVTLFDVADVSSIVVNAGDGLDVLNVLELPNGINLTADMGPGNDVVNVGGNDFDTNILGNLTINTGAGTDVLQISDGSDDIGNDVYTLTSTTFGKTSYVDTFVFSGVENVTLNASGFANTINVPTFSNIGTGLDALTINAGAGDDTINIGSGDVEENLAFVDLTVNGGAGADTLFYNDATDAEGNDSYTLTATTFDKNTVGVADHSFATVEAIRIDASGFDNVINLNGAPAGGAITINGNNGDDTFNVGNGDIDNALLFVTGQLNGGNGTDDLNLDNTTDGGGVDTYLMTSNSFDIGNTGVIGFATFNNILLDASPNADDIEFTGFGGFTTVRGNAGADTISLDGSYLGASTNVETGAGDDVVEINADGVGTTPVRFAQSETLGNLTVGAGGFLDVAAGGSLVLRVNNTAAINGRINLQDNSFIRGDGTVPNLNFYTQRLTNGYNGGDWLGAEPAIISTPADANNFALGYARASDIFGGGGGVFAGQAVPASAILIRFTRYGDTNLDGTVNLADFNRLASAFGLSNTLWSQGNLNYDNVTNLADFNKLAANFGLSAAADLSARSGAGRVSDLRKQLDRQTGGAPDVAGLSWSRRPTSDGTDEDLLESLRGPNELSV